MTIFRGTAGADEIVVIPGEEFDGIKVILGLAGDDEIDASFGGESYMPGGGDDDDTVIVGSDDSALGDDGDDELDAGDQGGNNRL